MSNPALDAILTAHAASGDARMLVPALDVCAGEEDISRVLDLAEETSQDSLSDAESVRLARAALEAGRPQLALRFSAGLPEAMPSEVGALLYMGVLDEAESRYREVVAENPALEQPELLERLMVARNDAGEESNVVQLATTRSHAPARGPTSNAELDNARLSFTDAASVTFKDVGGHKIVKKQIDRRIIAPFRKPALFSRFRRKSGGGVMLYGPPGCGKTLLARATAGECEARFINVPVTDVLDKFIGEPERKLAAIFEDARRETPTVLFFDEIEALASKRGTSSSNHEMAIVSTFLSEMDGFAQNNEGVLILAATNMPWGVDPAFRRSGRFDRMLFVPPPDKVARAEILRLQLDGRPGAGTLDLNAIAAKTSGFSGADIQNLVDTAADFAIEESIDAGGEVPISKAHFAEALEEVKATTFEWLTTARNFAKYGNSGGQYDEIAEFVAKHGK
ncbi:ATP-binding protein [Alteraurantiacibacter aquimixticola]|uniref:ATP-binding protein n=2 Tax=Alteraurantiacibacter aquimixticola TaxID=2489173 RepID=A0A4T3F528_9SPHN|nr:ATP-binding protein [Alteraurantiacibacter aquimixticola]